MNSLHGISIRNSSAQERQDPLPTGEDKFAPISLNFDNRESLYCGPFFKSIFLGSLGGVAAMGAQRAVYRVGDAVYGKSSVRLTAFSERTVSERSLPMHLHRFRILVAGPLFEEFLFRGVFRDLQIRGHRYFIGENENSPVSIVARTVTNAGLFTLLHWHPNPRFCGPRYLAAVFTTSCIFSGLAETTNGIFASTVAHGVYNFHIMRNRIAIR